MAGRFSVEAVFKAVDRVTAPVSRMQNRVGKMTRAMARGLRTANRALNSVIKGFKRAAGRVLKFGGILTGALITGGILKLNQLAEAADKLAKQSRRLDFPIEALQEWKFIAEQSGVSTELLDNSLGAFSKRLGEARAGMGPLVSGLKNLNPELLKQVVAAESIPEALDLYVKAMRDADSATEKAALANAAFSRSGLALVDISKNSVAAIEALKKEQRENGLITLQQAEAAEAYNDAVNSLKKSLTGILQGVLLPMLPVITKTVREWRKWIVANKEMIQDRVVTFLRDLRDAVKQIITAVIEFNRKYNLAELFIKTLDAGLRFGRFITTHGDAILKLGGVFLGLAAVLKIAAAALLITNLAMSANPVGLLVLGVAALVAGFVGLVTWIDDVSAGFDKMPFIIRLILAPIGALIEAIKFIKNNFGSIIAGAKSVGQFLGLVDDPEGDAADAEARAAAKGGANLGRRSMVSPQERVARSVEETRTTETSELVIKDETGRAEMTRNRQSRGIRLQPTGAF